MATLIEVCGVATDVAADTLDDYRRLLGAERLHWLDLGDGAALVTDEQADERGCSTNVLATLVAARAYVRGVPVVGPALLVGR
jgi:hypothetical protein